MRADRSIIGKQIGFITVLDLDHTESNVAYWKCHCSACGKEVIEYTKIVKKGKHSNCEYRNLEQGVRQHIPFKAVLADSVTAAKELGYSKECVDDLKTCKTEGEIERIMIRARHGGYLKNGKS